MTARRTPRQPPRRPIPPGSALFTPGATGARQSLEKASAKPIAFLHQLPAWLVPSVLAGLFVAGVFVHGWAGAVALCLVAGFVGWLASLSWPALGATGRLLRVVIILLVLALALWQVGR
jgi:hypothetical protein